MSTANAVRLLIIAEDAITLLLYAGSCVWVLSHRDREGFIAGRLSIVVGILVLTVISIGVQVDRWDLKLGWIEIGQQVSAILLVFGWVKLVAIRYERIVAVSPGVRAIDERVPQHNRRGASPPVS